MPRNTQPHTQTDQDRSFAQADVNPDDLPQTAGINDQAYDNRDGAETGGTRSPRHSPPSQNPHNTEQEAVAHEGSVTRRVSHDASKQGISNASAAKEAPGQEKVVSQRPDSQAGTNHSSRS